MDCPFCGSEELHCEVDDDYGGYYHYIFDCGTQYSYLDRLVTSWTNMPTVGKRCRLTRPFNPTKHQQIHLARIMACFDDHTRVPETEIRQDKDPPDDYYERFA